MFKIEAVDDDDDDDGGGGGGGHTQICLCSKLYFGNLVQLHLSLS
jgi:hypothetical protein